jgi:hypothetical protein
MVPEREERDGERKGEDEAQVDPRQALHRWRRSGYLAAFPALSSRS